MDYEVTETHILHKGRAFDFITQKVRYPDGREVTFELVQHPGAVAILPVDDEGNLWLVRQFRAGVAHTLLEIPAGTLEAGEDPAVCAGRELREEIGMGAGEITLLGAFYLAPGYSSEKMYVFLARGLFPESLAQDDDEVIEAEKWPLEEVFAMLERGDLKDAKTLAALAMGWKVLNG